MLIVEGPDGSGKSTLVARLAESLQMYVMPRMVAQDGTRMGDLVRWVHEDVTSGLKRAVYDRHRLISELVYGPLLRSTMEPGFDNINWLRTYQQRLRSKEPFVIFCLPPLEDVQKNVDGDASSEWMSDHVEQVYWMYHGLASTWPEPTVVWDYTKDDEMHTYRGNSRYSWLLSDITKWLFEKGMYEHG